MNIAIIPARGGSKRIPRKNIKLFRGKPIIAYSIEAALNSIAIDKVVVSTDDREIADIAIQYGAEVPFLREVSLADDKTGTTPVIRSALESLVALGWNVDVCACLYATAPFLTGTLINDAVHRLQQDNAEFVFTVNQFSFPIQRALLQTEQGEVTPFNPETIGKRSQDLPDTFHDAGQLYVANATTWLDKTKRVFSPQSRMIKLPSHLVQDIDTPEDWKRAEVLYKVLKEMGEC
ncbi:MAG: pseudaminic acid cytidylyltransferase [Alteromonas stellipolaris]|uniref:pseudaminic acid cytidylyltransferase n=1 Tax=Alteromonas stellipolaris TaxID=233316 RepID=UPI003B8DB919